MQKPSLGVSLLCFNNEKVLERSLANLKRLDFSAFSHVEIIVFDPAYPLRDKDNFNAVATRANAKVIDMTNKGQTENIRATVPYFVNFDYVLGWEPDADVRETRYLSIALKLMNIIPDVTYVCPKAEEWVYDKQGVSFLVSSEMECKEIIFAGGWPQTFYKGSAYQRLARMKPSCRGHYGGTEMDIYKALQPARGLMLRNVVDLVDQSYFDEVYQTWKHVTIGRDDQKDFKDTL